METPKCVVCGDEANFSPSGYSEWFCSEDCFEEFNEDKNELSLPVEIRNCNCGDICSKCDY